MERELSALREGAEQDQYERDRIARIGADLAGDAHDRGDLVAPGGLADQQEAREHREATGARHGQGHPRALAGVGAMLPVADQEERREAA